MSREIIQGDCVEVMAGMEPDSVDAIVCDPPYDLTSKKKGGTGAASLNLKSPAGRSRITTGGGFMGKVWDATGVAFDVATWEAAYRVLKPGGHLLAFGGSRTYHRMACAGEDAGFEIRDQIMWRYATGFPKSHNLKGEHEGWGTALKPAHEPIVVARKPLIGTVAANVQKHGTGAVNVDACRIETSGRPHREIDPKPEANGAVYAGRQEAGHGFDGGSRAVGMTTQGRWPANVILDESAGAMLDEQSGVRQSGGANGRRQASPNLCMAGPNTERVTIGGRLPDTGGASQFFYCPKASRKEREAGLREADKQGMNASPCEYDGQVHNNVRLRNHHPTVKPVALMRYLVRLVTPPGGVVLDPFLGSGTTLMAATLEGFDAIGIEREQEYVEIAEARVRWAESQPVQEKML